MAIVTATSIHDVTAQADELDILAAKIEADRRDLESTTDSVAFRRCVTMIIIPMRGFN